MSDMTLDPSTSNAMHALREHLPAAFDTLGLEASSDFRTWMHALDVKLLPKLNPEFPLVIAICGGGSAGKSTLFNTLVGRAVSPMGGRAGLNRRVLAALHDRHVQQAGLLAYLAQAFGGQLQTLEDAQQLTVPGDPLYCCTPEALSNVVLLDTPDIDTGARGTYANRELARQSLESADAFIYIFTNATYNNRDNTDFIAHLLTSLGTRPCFLIYRVYPSFTDDEVREHAGTVAHNLYPHDPRRHVLGVFRADEDNRVAAGQAPVSLRALDGNARDLRGALADLDAGQMRRQLMRAMMVDAVGQARGMHEQILASRRQLKEYRAALETAQRSAVQQALSHFPTDQVLRRFADIWVEGDPAHIKVMRQTGRVVEFPLKIVLSAVRHLRRLPTASGDGAGNAAGELPGQLQMDLLQAASALYGKAVGTDISGGAVQVRAPAAVRGAQALLRQKDWKATLTHIKAQEELILSWSSQLEKDLKALADTLRQRMGLIDQIRQTFSALLNVIPTTAAITYILHTADPAGAAGIKVKLTGLLGLNDLYALIAIPATAGMKNADQRQLEQLLAPVARTWLAHKLTAVQTLFEEHITGAILSEARTAADETERLVKLIDDALGALKEI
jgi:hypothetical protein